MNYNETVVWANVYAAALASAMTLVGSRGDALVRALVQKRGADAAMDEIGEAVRATARMEADKAVAAFRVSNM